tara:strand:- start:191 stop:949 length:759 start_codon:yes stop_codon:yes gene_type:complete
MINLKEKIKNKEVVIGTWNTIGSSKVTKIIASAGFDFQIIDLEHGPFVIGDIHDHVASSSFYKCPCFVRIPKNSDWMALQVLDQGANGIIVPQISNKSDAETFVKNTKYYPLGKRGFSPFTFAGGYNNNPEYVEEINKKLINVIIIESLDGINNIDQILEIEHIDVIYLGAFDLSKELGIPGDIYNKKLVDLINKCVDKINATKRIAGSFVPQNIDEVKFCIDMGIKFITYSLDSHRLRSSFFDDLELIRKL